MSQISHMQNKLTGKQQKFADEYIVCMNATEAARRAGYAGDSNALAAAGSRLLRNVKVLTYVSEKLNVFAMPANEVLVHLTDIARGDIADAFNGVGGIDPLEAARRGKSHLIKRFKVKTITTVDKDGEGTDIHETEIEMYDRLRALELLAKFHDLTNRVKVESWQDEIIRLLQSGRATPEEVREELGTSLAEELFIAAGIPTTAGGEGEATR